MSSACISSATATTTSLQTIDVITTGFSTSVSTESPTTTTITSEVCPLGSIDGLPCLSTPTIFTSTIPGNTTTISIPFTDTVQSIATQTLTLFGTSCPSGSSAAAAAVASASNSSSALPISNGPGNRSFVSLSPSLSTPPPSIWTSPVPTTLSDGEVSAIMETFTSSLSPSIIYVPLGPSGQVAQSNNDRSSSQIGPVVGGVLGGFFGLLGIVLIIWLLLKRRRRWDDIFDQEGPSHSPGRRPTKRWSLDADIEPKPYQYGLVGQASVPSLPSLGVSQPDSPPATTSSLPSQLPRPNHSLTPLLLPTSASTPGPSATTLSSRPSTAGSMQPLASTGGNHKQTDSSGSSTSVQQHVSPAMPSHWGHHSPNPSTDRMHVEHERSGSPTSIDMLYWEPQRKLQLANPGDGDSLNSPMSPSPSVKGGKGRNGHGRLASSLSGILVDAAP